jgi:exopolysaccharide biosynthesis polyprenyl glycosylphosphotransferase
MHSTLAESQVRTDLRAAAAPRTVAVADRLARSPARRRRIVVRRMLMAADIVGLLGAFAISEIVTAQLSPDRGVSAPRELVVLLLAIPVWVAIGQIHHVYENDVTRAAHTAVDDFNGVFHTITVGTVGIYLAAHLTRIAQPDLTKMSVFWATSIALVMALRIAARGRFRRHETFHQNAVVLGAGTMGQIIARKLRQHPEFGVNVVGFLDTSPRDLRGDLGDLAVLGSPDHLMDVVETLGVERVIVAFDLHPDTETLDILRPLEHLQIQIDIIPRLFGLFGPDVGYQLVDGLPVLHLCPNTGGRLMHLVKRVLDVTIASAMLVFVAPVMVMIALWIRRDSPGPVLFRQERVGLGQTTFTMLKFRTMVTGTSADAHRAYVAGIAGVDAQLGENGMFKADQSASVTRSGSFLRRTSFDELPQLFNVLRGDMSIVGPRPCLPYEVELMSAHQLDRFSVRPGLTGLWQVTARGHASFHEALELDLAYVRGQSFWLDLRILFLTPIQMLRPKATR